MYIIHSSMSLQSKLLIVRVSSLIHKKGTSGVELPVKHWGCMTVSYVSLAMSVVRRTSGSSVLYVRTEGQCQRPTIEDGDNSKAQA